MDKKAQMMKGLIVTVIGIVVLFIVMRVGIFTDATVADALPNDSLSATQQSTLDDMEEKQGTVYKVIMVVIIISLIALIIYALMQFA